MTTTAVTPATFWAAQWAQVQPSWVLEAQHIIAAAEARRSRAKFNTGSISVTAALALRAVCAWVVPTTVIEVGTFIGVSTLSLRADRIYTCDVSNDCLANGPNVWCFPYQTSTQMFLQLIEADVVADVFFLDGRLTKADPPLVAALSHTRTVYVFDDYNGQFKGIHNVKLLRAQLPHHVLLPAAGPVAEPLTTLAVMVPEAML